MADTQNKDQFLNSEAIPRNPEKLHRKIEYEPESDTLWLGNEGPAPNGMDLFAGCIVFFDNERRVTGIMVESAKELLLPVLLSGKPLDSDG